MITQEVHKNPIQTFGLFSPASPNNDDLARLLLEKDPLINEDASIPASETSALEVLPLDTFENFALLEDDELMKALLGDFPLVDHLEQTTGQASTGQALSLPVDERERENLATFGIFNSDAEINDFIEALIEEQTLSMTKT